MWEKSLGQLTQSSVLPESVSDLPWQWDRSFAQDSDLSFSLRNCSLSVHCGCILFTPLHCGEKKGDQTPERFQSRTIWQLSGFLCHERLWWQGNVPEWLKKKMTFPIKGDKMAERPRIVLRCKCWVLGSRLRSSHMPVRLCYTKP